jgi:putative DNA primase/helicase
MLRTAMQPDFPDYDLDPICKGIYRLRYATDDPNIIVKDVVCPAVLTEQIETTADDVDETNEEQSHEEPEKVGIDILDSFLEQITKVTFPANKHGVVATKTYYIEAIANLLKTAKKHGLDIGMKHKAPHFYNGRFWRCVEEDTSRYFLQQAGTKMGIPRLIVQDHQFADKLVKQCASAARFPVSITDDIPKINLRNGTLYFTRDEIELKPFDKRDGMTYQLDYDFDPSTPAPIFQKFLDRALPSIDEQKLLFQYIAYVFFRNMKLERVMFFDGGGADGKSVILDVITGLVGREQCCSFGLEGITKSEYQRAEFGNYLLNISSEISTSMETATFKKIASRETLQARHPHGRPFNVHEYATSFFSMNKSIRTVEPTRAFYRRFLILSFEASIADAEQDPDLAKKIIASEMSGVLNLVIEGAKALSANRKFDIPQSVVDRIDEFRKDTDTVWKFMDEHRYRPDATDWITLRTLYELYKTYYRDDVSIRDFSRRLRDLGYEVKAAPTKDHPMAVFATGGPCLGS